MAEAPYRPSMITYQPDADSVAVLASGGLDSSLLLAMLLDGRSLVYPLYVRGGLRWEQAELAALQEFLNGLSSPRLRPLTVLDLPLGDLYGRHWSLGSGAVPNAASPDEAVFLPGRNLLLLSKASIWCQLHRVSRLVLGVLGSNPFTDGQAEFLAQFEELIAAATAGWPLRIDRPLARWTKREIMAWGRHLPLERTFSCLDPQAGLHCGHCNKCRERRSAFAAAELRDPTPYATAGCPRPGSA